MRPYTCRIVAHPAVIGGRTLDWALIARAKAGDDHAFDDLLRPLIASAYRLAGAMLHDPHAAEDVVQNASLKAWKKLHQLRPGAEMGPWFLGIVANECRDMRRSRWWTVIKQAEPEQPAGANGEAPSALIDLRRAICRLKYRRRLVLVLHWYLDLPLAEVAAITHSSEDAVKSEVSRAVAQLRKLLGAVEV